MSKKLSDFTKGSSIDDTDHIIGYANTSAGGERRWTVADLKQAVVNNNINTGEVGIGGDPDTGTKLLVKGNTSGNLVQFTQSGPGNALFVEDMGGDASPMVIANNGRVGIGTTAPNTNLQVVGTTYTTVLSTPSIGINPTIKGRVTLKQGGGLAYAENSNELYIIPPGGETTLKLVVRPSGNSTDRLDVERITIPASEDNNMDGDEVLSPYFKTFHGAIGYRNKFIQGDCVIYVDENTFESQNRVTNSNVHVNTFTHNGVEGTYISPKTPKEDLLGFLVFSKSNEGIQYAPGKLTIKGRFLTQTTTTGVSKWTQDRKFNQPAPKIRYRVYFAPAGPHPTAPTSYTDWKSRGADENVKITYDGILAILSLDTECDMINVCFDCDTNARLTYFFGVYNKIAARGLTISLKGPTLYDRAVGVSNNCSIALGGDTLRSPLWTPTANGADSGSLKLYPSYGICVHTDGTPSNRTTVHDLFQLGSYAALDGDNSGGSKYSDDVRYSHNLNFHRSVIFSGHWNVIGGYFKLGKYASADFTSCPLAFGYGNSSSTSLTSDDAKAGFIISEDNASVKVNTGGFNYFWSLSNGYSNIKFPIYLPIPLGKDLEPPITDVGGLIDSATWSLDLNVAGASKFKFKPYLQNFLNYNIQTSVSGSTTLYSTAQTRDVAMKDIYFHDEFLNAFEVKGNGDYGLYAFKENNVTYKAAVY